MIIDGREVKLKRAQDAVNEGLYKTSLTVLFSKECKDFVVDVSIGKSDCPIGKTLLDVELCEYDCQNTYLSLAFFDNKIRFLGTITQEPTLLTEKRLIMGEEMRKLLEKKNIEKIYKRYPLSGVPYYEIFENENTKRFIGFYTPHCSFLQGAFNSEKLKPFYEKRKGLIGKILENLDELKEEAGL